MSTNALPSENAMAQNEEISKKVPYISVKELRKILGVDAKELDDNQIRNISVGLGKIALLLTNNPDFPLKGTLCCQRCGVMIRGSSPTGGSGKPSPRYYCVDCTGAGSVAPSKMHDKFLLALN